MCLKPARAVYFQLTLPLDRWSLEPDVVVAAAAEDESGAKAMMRPDLRLFSAHPKRFVEFYIMCDDISACFCVFCGCFIVCVLWFCFVLFCCVLLCFVCCVSCVLYSRLIR